MPSPDVLILGGGLLGLSCARELHRSGRTVEVLERGRAGKGPSASWASAGMLAPLFDDPVPGPFLDACLASRDLWRDWGAELIEASGHDLDLDTSGSLVVDRPESAALRDLRREALDLGEPAERVPEEELRRRLPGLSEEPCEGLHLAGEYRVDNRKVLFALGEVLRRDGVRVLEGHEVLRVEVRGEEVLVRGKSFTRSAGRLLVAAGAASGAIPGLPQLPVRPVRGQMICFEETAWPWRGPVRWDGAYAVSRGRDRLLVGSTLEEGDLRASPTAAGMAQILGRFLDRFPGLADRPIRSSWAGLRPGSPDGWPILGPDPREPRIWWATGHYRNGVLLTPWTAIRIAESWEETAEVSALAPFSAARPGLDPV